MRPRLRHFAVHCLSLGMLNKSIDLVLLVETKRVHTSVGAHTVRAAFTQSLPLTRYRSPPKQPPDDLQRHDRQAAAKELKKMLAKKHGLNEQNLTRHEAVLKFLNVQSSRRPGETREEMALLVACCHGKGPYFARKVITWELGWLRGRKVSERKRGCFPKTPSQSKEGAQLEYVESNGE